MNVKYQKCKHGLEKEDLADTTYHTSRGLGKLQESMKSETEKVGLCFIILNAFLTTYLIVSYCSFPNFVKFCQMSEDISYCVLLCKPVRASYRVM